MLYEVITLTILAYSSLAVVLLIATLAASSVIGIQVALGLVLGANLGSGLLAMLSTLRSPPEARRVTLGNFLFKLIACAAVVPLLGLIEPHLGVLGDEGRRVVLFVITSYSIHYTKLYDKYNWETEARKLQAVYERINRERPLHPPGTVA